MTDQDPPARADDPTSSDPDAPPPVADLAEHLSVSKDTIWRWTRNGDFPAPVKLSPQMTRWRWADVQAWEQSRTAA